MHAHTPASSVASMDRVLCITSGYRQLRLVQLTDEVVETRKGRNPLGRTSWKLVENYLLITQVANLFVFASSDWKLVGN